MLKPDISEKSELLASMLYCGGGISVSESA